MRKGEGNLPIYVVIAVFIAIGFAALGYGPSLMRENKLKGLTQDQMRRFASLGEHEMRESLVRLFNKEGANIKYEEILFEGGVNIMSKLRIEYEDEMNFIVTKKPRIVIIEMKFKIPPKFSG